MIDRYSRKELRNIWSDENKYKIWLDIELAAAEAMEKLNIIPRGVVKKVKSKAKINVTRILKIEESVKQVAQIENQISDTELTLKYQEIVSPLDGIVFDLQPAAPGYVVGSNDKQILKIVPIDDLVARVFVSNKDKLSFPFVLLE